MTRWTLRTARAFVALSMAVVAAAHVGSPNVYFAGKAGPYALDVAIRPPQVVPGIAEVFIHVDDPSVSSVVIRPVFWRAGTKGAPAGDAAAPVKGSPGSFSGQLWLMASGSYSVHVTVAGQAGTGTVMVPVNSVATGQLALSPFLEALLAVLATLLVAGIITAVHAAVGESQVPPGETMSPDLRRRARRAAIITVPLLALVILGGANWWKSEADRYRRTLYKPVRTQSSVSKRDGAQSLTLTITDSNWRAGNATPVMPDHGKLAHMFLVRADSPFVFAHLHPEMLDRATMVTPLPPLLAGRYRVFTDIVQESGFQRTLVDSMVLSTSFDSSGITKLGPDDAWSTDELINANSPVKWIRGHEGGLYMRWAGPEHIVANQPGVLRIGLSDRRGEAVSVEPYLGMNGHAVVVRDNGSVFVHLHPSGTSSMASELAFALRDRGDTTRDGRLRLDAAPMSHADSTAKLTEIRFPYAFPSPGLYLVYAQVRAAGQVHTTGFKVRVEPSR